MIVGIIAAVLLVLAALYVFALKGGGRKDAMRPFHEFGYAHRGLHGNGVPENSRKAFTLAASHGFGAELDVHLTADGHLAVVHDNTLMRVAGDDRRVCEMTRDELAAVTLEGTSETVPMLDEILPLFEKTPLIIELKAERGNHAALCEAVCAMLNGHKGTFVIESFDPRCLLWLKKHRPDILRGQLSQNFFKGNDVAWPLKCVLTSLVLNAVTRPDFVAYNRDHRSDIPFRLYRSLWKGDIAWWTVRGKDAIADAKTDDAMIIFEM